MRRLSIFVLGLVACGGVVDPQPSPVVVSNDDAGEAASEAPDASDAAPVQFACLILAASTPTFVECTTLPDGGPSYVDGVVDCRTYDEGAGQGCAPPMACTADYDGASVTGSCAQVP
jgi:hypothetical protein